MRSVSPETKTAITALITLLHVFAIGLTFFRVWYRSVTKRLWWDDWTALAAVIVDCGYISTIWFPYAPADSFLQSHPAKIGRYWATVLLFLIVIWLTRISLALGIARIFPPRHVTRRFSIGLAFLSTALCLVLIIQISAVCSRQPLLRERAVCIWPLSLRVLVIVASCLADLFLVVTPLYKLWKVKLPKEQRRLILGGFTAGFTTTAITLVCAGFQYAPTEWEPAKGFIRGNLTFFECGISLIVCNLLVVITYFYLVHRREHPRHRLSYDTTSETCEPRGPTVIHSNMPPENTTVLTMTEITDHLVSVPPSLSAGSSIMSETSMAPSLAKTELSQLSGMTQASLSFASTPTTHSDSNPMQSMY